MKLSIFTKLLRNIQQHPGIVVLFVIPVLYFVPGIDRFLFLAQSEYSDIAISHLPNAIYIRNSLINYGQIPLWSDAILSGYPFAADPLSGLWYPFAWIAVLFPSAFGFNMLFILHVWLLGLGMYFFLRQEGCSEGGSLSGAIALSLMPKLILHFAAGHISLIEAISWTPWLLWAVKKSWLNSSKFQYILEVPFLALIILADVRWAAYAALLWGAYKLQIAYSDKTKDKHEFRASLSSGLALIGRMALVIGLTLCLCSPFLLPFFEFVSLSTRSEMEIIDRTAQSLPLSQLLGLIIPGGGGAPEYVGYMGVIGNLAILLTLSVRNIRKKGLFWLGLLALFLVLSLGNALPFFNLFSSIPGASLLRVPARFLFLVNICSAVLIGHAVDALLKQKLNYFWNPFIYYLAITIFVLLISFGMARTSNSLSMGFWLVCVVYAFLSLLFLARERNWIRPTIWLPVILLIGLVDVCSFSFSKVEYKDASAVLAENSHLLKLMPDSSDWRIYSPSYSLPQQTAATLRVELADGINPLQLTAYKEYMEQATGIQWDEYSVTLPPYRSGSPEIDNQAAIPDASLLGLLNVKYVAAAYELDSDGLEMVGRSENIFIYKNLLALPRAWLQNTQSWPPNNPLAISIDLQSPNVIKLHASGPGFVVLSEMDYPGWTAYVDGERVPISKMGELFRSVRIEAGEHEIIFAFYPKYLAFGFILSLVALAVMFFLFRIRKKPGNQP